MGDESVFVGTSPWQQWGNTQLLTVQASSFVQPNTGDASNTLCRITYGRPETWRFLLAAKIISGPSTTALQQANASVWFDLYTGIGRSAIQIPFWATLPGWQWNFGASLPRNQLVWINTAPTNAQIFTTETTTGDVNTTSSGSQSVLADLIVGQDLTLVARATFTTDIPQPVQPLVIEVSAQFAPNTHVRPDWFQIDATPSEQFPGGEVRGR